MTSHLKSAGSTTAWRKLRKRILERDQYICQYCGNEADTVDHVIERSKGGTDSLDNLVAACRRCNFGRVGSRGGFFNSAKTPLTLPVPFTPENRSISHD